MKLTIIFLIVAVFQVNAHTSAQTVSYSAKAASIPTVLSAFEKQTGYLFFFRKEDMSTVKPVSVDLNNVPLTDALHELLKGLPLKFTIRGNTVFIKKDETLAFVRPPGLEIELRKAVIGKVVDMKGVPIQGVSVTVKGTSRATTTDIAGRYSIDVPEDGTLVFTSVSHETQSVPVKGKTQIDVMLRLKISSLEDYIVVGYGSTKRKDLTGSVSSVDVKEVRDAPFVSIDQALTGKAAGVQVVQADGSPGGVAKIRIRGGTSLMGSNDPLYIIDGVQVQIQNRYLQNQAEAVNPIERFGSDDPNSSVSGAFARGLNSLAGLNINDIESIDILKDASATAIYGSRAANGVVIITTKKGKQNQKPVLEANYYTGFTKAIKQDLLDAEQYKMITKEAAKNLNDERANAGLPLNARAYAILTNPDYLGTANTDWLGLVMRTGITQNADISVRGGGTGSRYYTSLAYQKQQGALKGTDFQRISGKINLDNEITHRLRIIANLDYGFTKNNITNGIYAQALYAPPTLPAYNPDGSVYQFTGSRIGGYDYEGYQNPLALLQGINEGKTSTLLGSLAAEVDILKDLKFRSVVSVNYTNYHQLNYVPSTAVIASPNGIGSSNGGTGSQSQTENTSMFYENTLTWDKQFNDQHRLNVVGGTTWQKDRFNTFSASGQGFPDDKFLNNLSSAAVALAPTGTSGQSSLLSFFMRANYSLKERYLFTFTGRSDASSKFPKVNRVGYFPSGGVAWRISEENFLKDVKWLDELKIRASAGLTGTQNIGDNLFYTLYTPGSYNRVNAMIPTQLGNDDIKWESTMQKDLGLDFSFLNARIRGSFGYYEKKTDGLLMSTILPPSSSYASVISNFATIVNKGLEFDIRADIIRGRDFQWNAAFNISGNRSKVLDIAGDFTDPNGDPALAQYYLGNSIVRKGEPIGLFYGKIFQGLYQNQKQIDDYKAANPYWIYFNPFVNIGDAMYERDSTGFDKQDVIGHAQPKFYGGFTNTLNYKNFNLIVLFTYSYGGEVLYLQDVQNKFVSGQTNKSTAILDRWTPENPNADRPRLIMGGNSTAYTASNDVYDASFIKLKSVTLSYRLPDNLMKKWRMRDVNVYVSGTNLITISSYPGPDPEVSGDPYSLINGATDSGTFPTVRQYSAGVRIGF
ncbi:TonB-dependent receptor [Pseudobacter ginsenosidimutans]|nr:TonB-dependent receptor [Pseudobacter ginsenosidimutans]